MFPRRIGCMHVIDAHSITKTQNEHVQTQSLLEARDSLLPNIKRGVTPSVQKTLNPTQGDDAHSSSGRRKTAGI